MLKSRITPCLLVHNKGLVKTVKFKEGKYVGDPINAVRIFNEKEVDELIVLDIDASANGVEPNYKMIENLASECRMPLCYGGGIKTSEQAEEILSLGVEKVAISSVAIENPQIITEIAEQAGSQSVIVVLDVKKRRFGSKYEVWTHNGTKNTKQCPFELIEKLEKLGVGEFVINSIDQDGVMKGYDQTLIQKVHEIINVPMTALGGAGSLDDIKGLVQKYGIIGAAAGSFFVFKGVYKALLINYPNAETKRQLLD